MAALLVRGAVVPVGERGGELHRSIDATIACSVRQRGSTEKIKAELEVLLNANTGSGADKQHAETGGKFSELSARADLQGCRHAALEFTAGVDHGFFERHTRLPVLESDESLVDHLNRERKFAASICRKVVRQLEAHVDAGVRRD